MKGTNKSANTNLVAYEHEWQQANNLAHDVTRGCAVRLKHKHILTRIHTDAHTHIHTHTHTHTLIHTPAHTYTRIDSLWSFN